MPFIVRKFSVYTLLSIVVSLVCWVSVFVTLSELETIMVLCSFIALWSPGAYYGPWSLIPGLPYRCWRLSFCSSRVVLPLTRLCLESGACSTVALLARLGRYLVVALVFQKNEHSCSLRSGCGRTESYVTLTYKTDTPLSSHIHTYHWKMLLELSYNYM